MKQESCRRLLDRNGSVTSGGQAPDSTGNSGIQAPDGAARREDLAVKSEFEAVIGMRRSPRQSVAWSVTNCGGRPTVGGRSSSFEQTAGAARMKIFPPVEGVVKRTSRRLRS